jgi:diguanylate cyclase (GGDEF)-like protein/PAS domain S-box-containing protein
VCLTLLAFDGWREWVGYKSVLQRTEAETRNLAASLSQHADDTFELAEQTIGLVANMTEEDGPDASVELLRRTAGASGRLSSLHVLDANGHLVGTTALNLPPGTDFSALDYFQHHAASYGSSIRYGPPVTSPAGTVDITLSRRLDAADGSFAGVVVASVDTRYFSDIYRGVDVGAHGVINLFAADGTLLSRSPYRPELIGRRMAAVAPSATDFSSDGGVYQYVSTVDGMPRIAGWNRSETRPTLVTVAVSRDETLASWVEGAFLRFAVTFSIVLVIGLLGLRLASQAHRRQKSEAVLAQKEAEFRLLAESASDLVERFGADGTRTYISPALERMTGYTPAELLGENAFEVLNDEDRPAVEAAADRLRRGISEQETVTFRRIRKDGREIWLETSLRVAADVSDTLSVVAVTRDITDRKQLELQLEAMAMLDGLTGLANRRAFDAALAREVSRARRTRAPLALLMIDADRFKRFNDDYGHLPGDACLKAIASVVAMAARRPTDVAARYGGEEMALLLPGTDLMSAHAIANDIVRQVQGLAIPHARNLPWKVVTVSIGTAVIDPHDTDTLHDAAWLISTADLALYDAKAHGRNQAIATPRRVDQRLVG